MKKLCLHSYTEERSKVITLAVGGTLVKSPMHVYFLLLLFISVDVVYSMPVNQVMLGKTAVGALNLHQSKRVDSISMRGEQPCISAGWEGTRSHPSSAAGAPDNCHDTSTTTPLQLVGLWEERGRLTAVICTKHSCAAINCIYTQSAELLPPLM